MAQGPERGDDNGEVRALREKGAAYDQLGRSRLSSAGGHLNDCAASVQQPNLAYALLCRP
ncbi:hypothetical protein FHT79_002017 [Rhizobium sp. BK212]|uniref:hypothetical protein n=1 Tax=Rhizobium sp. BK212 TaxID=2587074 RepID=UPI0017AFA75C|nr:hypothetical protein [Rhizobium sp. BK212]MBB4214848.1 hypothetical protein [Rhizobium sp. BK212]